MELEKKINERVEVWLKATSKTLDISNLGLKKWPDVLKSKERRRAIVGLDCRYNQLTSLPLLPNLTYLVCHDNRLTSFPLFPKLIYLECSNNRLAVLPLFPKLIDLYCYECNLTVIPVLPNLEELYCSVNALVAIPELPNLTRLECSYNPLISIPLFPKLIELECFNNQLTAIPPLPNLTKLWCYDNNLFSYELTGWKKVWCLKALRSNETRSRGLKRVVKVLKNRLYLPRLENLKQELIYSPNHPGKFYKSLRMGNWRFETKLTNKS